MFPPSTSLVCCGINISPFPAIFSPADDVEIAVGPPSRLEWAVPTPTTTGGVAYPSFTVTVLDLGNNTVVSAPGNIELTIGSGVDGAQLSGTTSVALVAGIATFSNAVLDKASSGPQVQ